MERFYARRCENSLEAIRARITWTSKEASADCGAYEGVKKLIDPVCGKRSLSKGTFG